MRPGLGLRLHCTTVSSHLPGSAFSRVEQGRIAEERREHPLDPAGLSRAVVLIFCLLVLCPT